jgi:hypothetical protein
MESGQYMRQISRTTIIWPRPSVNIPNDRQLAEQPLTAQYDRFWQGMDMNLAVSLCNLSVAVQNGRLGQLPVVLGD